MQPPKQLGSSILYLTLMPVIRTNIAFCKV